MRKRKTISLDLRERILAAYDEEEDTREAIALRFRVSLGMVKKLLQQRSKTGDIANQHHRAGRKPIIGEAHQKKMRTLLGKKPEMTLSELRDALGLQCSVQAIHMVLAKLGLSNKERRAAQPKKTTSTIPKRTKTGSGSKPRSSRQS